jgi:hypothetical protein
MFQKYSKLCLPGQYGKVRRAGQYMSKDAKQKPCHTTALQAAPTEGLTGDSDLRLHHMPEDLELLNHK